MMDVDEGQEFEDFFGGGDDQAQNTDNNQENGDDVPTDADVLSRIMKKTDKGAGKTRGTTDRKRPVIPKLGPNEVTGKRGIAALYEDFKDYKLNPNVNEYDNLEGIMKKIEHWGHLLYPRLHFDDLTKKLDVVGQKAPVKLHMRHLRHDTGPYDPENAMYIYGSSQRKADEAVESKKEDHPRNREASPPPKSTNTIQDSFYDDYFNNPDGFDETPTSSSATFSRVQPAAPSVVASQSATPTLTDAQKKRIEENKRRAMEIREKRLKFLETQKKEEEERLQKEAEERAPEAQRAEQMEEDMIDEDEALQMMLGDD